MNKGYLMVHKSILPSCYEKVIRVRELIEKEKFSVSDACKKEEISRSTFYKYKDYIFTPTVYYDKRILIAVKVINKPGSLSIVLNHIADNKGNIITISQETPIHDFAYITISVDTSNMTISLKKMLENIKDLKNVASVKLIAVE